MEERELLKYAIEHDMINLSYVQEQIEMTKRKEVLQKHPYSIWFSQKEERWYTHVPFMWSESKKKRINRKNNRDLEDEIVAYTLEYEKLTEKKKSDSYLINLSIAL